MLNMGIPSSQDFDIRLPGTIDEGFYHNFTIQDVSDVSDDENKWLQYFLTLKVDKGVTIFEVEDQTICRYDMFYLLHGGRLKDGIWLLTTSNLDEQNVYKNYIKKHIDEGNSICGYTDLETILYLQRSCEFCDVQNFSWGKPIMSINLKVKLAYGTFHSTYKNEGKIKENMVLVDNIAAASKDAALRATQEAANDPHVLSREENNVIIMNVMGYNNRGRFPLMGVGAQRGTSRKSSMASSTTSTATTSPNRTLASSTIMRINRYLRGKIDRTLLMRMTTAMCSDLPPSPTRDDVFTHIVLYLSGKILAELFEEVLDQLDLDVATQAGLAGGSNSGVQMMELDDDEDS
ncbi:uncharacterized protein A4U43_C07F30930 [Asparagus officinalis]|uniref:Uncharacterized protein n=1 Tax=Asparagus officinalis TaxID=4686 RepID=A0A5P1EI63_ASPOF|nr:uncharacterized protein A4U43_C07F30930 [Asparagus officinalis]